MSGKWISASGKLGLILLIGTLGTKGLYAQYEAQHMSSADAEQINRITATSAQTLESIRSQATPNSIRASQALTMLRGSDGKTLQPTAGKLYVMWHQVALDVTSVDHTATLGASPSTYHEQFGPARTSRALALVHLAMFEALNGTVNKQSQFVSYLKPPSTIDFHGDSDDVLQGAAIMEASYGTLSWLYPGLTFLPLTNQAPPVSPHDCSQSTRGFSLYFYYICSITSLSAQSKTPADLKAVADGRAYGKAVVAALVKAREGDGSNYTEPSFGTSDFTPTHVIESGQFPLVQWQPDPVSATNVVLGGHWGDVTPFALDSGQEFRLSDDDAAIHRFDLDSPTKLKTTWPSYSTVHDWGTEPRLSPHVPNDQKFTDLYYIAKFWAYDASAGLCAPVRLYNEVADAFLVQQVLTQKRKFDLLDEARYYALINIAMSDAAVAAWDSKYHFQLARPVTVIRSPDQTNKSHLPSLLSFTAEAAAIGAPPKSVDPDANTVVPMTQKEAEMKDLWYPLGAQNTNASATFNTTPPFPSYPSGHAVFGGALFGILRQYSPASTDGLHADPSVQFEFQSDEFNTRNHDIFNFYRCVDGDTANKMFCNNIPAKATALPMFGGRQFKLDCAERENADSRVWMGVHWMFDADDGIYMGNKVAQQVWNAVLQPTKADMRDLDRFVEQTSTLTIGDMEKHMVLNQVQRSKLLCPGVNVPDGVLSGLDKSYSSSGLLSTKRP